MGGLPLKRLITSPALKLRSELLPALQRLASAPASSLPDTFSPGRAGPSHRETDRFDLRAILLPWSERSRQAERAQTSGRRARTLRDQIDETILTADTRALFQIANKFWLRHNDRKQMRGYDSVIWLDWIFYVYVATAHALLATYDRQVLADSVFGPEPDRAPVASTAPTR
jgi:hypothetical protein